MKYTIEWTDDTLPSKKNSKQLRKNFKTGKNFISSSNEYHNWEKLFILEVKSLGYTLGKVQSAMFTFLAPNKRKFDLDNKLSSILDSLVKSGFLDNDDYEHIPDIRLKFGGISESKKWEVKMKFEK